MTEQTDAPQGGAEEEAIASSPEVETPTEATTEQPTGADEPGQADDAGEATEEPVKRVPWFQKRIDEVTAKRYEAEREAAFWRGKAEAGQRQEPTQPEPATLPTLEQFDYDEAKFTAALADAIRKETEKTLDRTLSERERSSAEEQKNIAAITKLQEGGSKHPDFIAAVSGLPANEAIRDFILEDPRATDVLYELGKDQAAAERFSSLSPVQQAIELGRRAAAPAKVASKPIPPAPPQTVGGMASGLNKSLEDMSYSEFVKAREEQEKTRN
jgi:hypothetical protein